MSATNQKAKLYIYQHCPYCSRVEIVIGLKNLPVEIAYLPNGDEKAHTDLCGKKQVPILIKSDGSVLLESLDIAKFLDESSGEPLLKASNPDKKALVDFTQNNRLTHPRFIRMGFPEFARQEDIDYFVNKKTKDIGNFEENMSKTEEFKKADEEKLRAIAHLFPSVEQIKNTAGGINGDWSWDDIMVFPRIRALTCVKGFEFPENVMAYMKNLSEKAKMQLYLDKAI
jgi:glutaredoxin 2